jgi:hypothetical protein
MRKHIAIALLAASLSGCMSFRVEKNREFDPREKTITIQRGGGPITAPVKQALKENGWNIYTSTDAVRTTGINAGRVDLRSSTYGNARYSLEIVDGVYEGKDMQAVAVAASCGILFPMLFLPPDVYRLNISVVDNKTGEEVLILTGGGFIPTMQKVIKENMR